jgi:hypothetical protein
MMPTSGRGLVLSSFQDLLPSAFEMPEWLIPLIKALYFMQYFSGEMALPRDILQEIYKETIPLTSCLD